MEDIRYAEDILSANKCLINSEELRDGRQKMTLRVQATPGGLNAVFSELKLALEDNDKILVDAQKKKAEMQE